MKNKLTILRMCNATTASPVRQCGCDIQQRRTYTKQNQLGCTDWTWNTWTSNIQTP